jgi:hypothetical protein
MPWFYRSADASLPNPFGTPLKISTRDVNLARPVNSPSDEPATMGAGNTHTARFTEPLLVEYATFANADEDIMSWHARSIVRARFYSR